MRCLMQCVWLLALLAGSAFADDAAPGMPRVSVELVTRGYPVPDDAFQLTVDPDGELRGLDGHTVTDEALKRVLKPRDDRHPPTIIKLTVGNEKETPIATVGGAIDRISACAFPKSDVTVYLALRSIKKPTMRRAPSP